MRVCVCILFDCLLFFFSALGGEIINGREVPKDSLPFMVSVQKNGRHGCGGLLIRKNLVLTAAHCDNQ